MSKGIDLMPQDLVKIQVGDRLLPLNFGPGIAWAYLEAHYGGSLFKHTIPTVFGRLVDGHTNDILFITWCGLQHLGPDAPAIEEVQRVDLLPLVIGEKGVGDGSLFEALSQALPKTLAPNPTSAAGADAKDRPVRLTGIGSALSTLRRWFSAGPKSGSGMR